MKYAEKLGDGFIIIEDKDLKSYSFPTVWHFLKKWFLLILGGAIIYFIFIILSYILGFLISFI